MVLSGEVLIVDDTPGNLQVLGAILHGSGLTVRMAPNGAFALRSVAIRRPDLVLLDIRMPDMDGLEVCRQLMSDLATAGMPILFLSASQDPEERLEAFQAGGMDFIAKPFHAEEVLARVSTHLTLARLRSELAAANARLRTQVVDERAGRRQAEFVAQERQIRLELALGAAGMGTWVTAGPDSPAQLDPEARAILGREERPAEGWDSLLAGFAAGERAAIASAWRDGLASRRAVEVEGWWEVGNDRRRIRIRGRQLVDPENGSDRVVGLVWDVTDEYRLRSRLAQSEKLESLGQLAGGLAHDFNNHLAIILGNLEALRRNVASDQRSLERLANIDRAALTATALVRDLLTFARRRELTLERVALAEVVTDLDAMLRSMLGRGIALEIGLLDPAVAAMGSRQQLQNAILNLCVNARDAMPAGGTLRLSVRRRDDLGGACRICADPANGPFAEITVGDTGEGIPEPLQARIFEPFFTTKPDGKGTGLGLATVAGCVTAHHGHLALESHPGQGSTFRILLPLAD